MKKQPTKKSGRKRRNEMKLLVFNLINAERYIRSKEKLCEPGFYACCTRKWIYALVCCLFVSYFILWQREEKKFEWQTLFPLLFYGLFSPVLFISFFLFTSFFSLRSRTFPFLCEHTAMSTSKTRKYKPIHGFNSVKGKNPFSANVLHIQQIFARIAHNIINRCAGKRFCSSFFVIFV